MFGKASRHAKTPHRRRPSTRPAVEQLEGRTVPAFTVPTLNDAGTGSLREAIDAANATPEADAIVFHPKLSGTIRLAGQLNVTGPLTITGSGAGVITLSGENSSRVFLVDNGSVNVMSVTISGLTLTGGRATGSNQGGAVEVTNEDLTLRGVVITGNTARDGGGVYVNPTGRLTLEDCIISGNSATGTSGYGGGVYLAGDSVAVIRNSAISGNSAAFGGGGIDVDPGGSLTVEGSTISANRAVRVDSVGGGIVATNDSVTVIRNSTISVNSAAFGGGIIVGTNGRLTLEGSTVCGNQADADDGQGGGIYVSEGGSLTVTNSTVSGNSARADGGGIFITKGSLTIRNSTVAFNAADADNAGGGQGGGLFADAGAAVTLLSTIVADNAVGATGLHP